MMQKLVVNLYVYHNLNSSINCSYTHIYDKELTMQVEGSLSGHSAKIWANEHNMIMNKAPQYK